MSPLSPENIASRDKYIKRRAMLHCIDKARSMGANEVQVFALQNLMERYDYAPLDCQTLIGDASCIMVKMGPNENDPWTGIEKDGYTHQ